MKMNNEVFEVVLNPETRAYLERVVGERLQIPTRGLGTICEFTARSHAGTVLDVSFTNNPDGVKVNVLATFPNQHVVPLMSDQQVNSLSEVCDFNSWFDGSYRLAIQ